jgi:hypothetical protein
MALAFLLGLAPRQHSCCCLQVEALHIRQGSLKLANAQVSIKVRTECAAAKPLLRQRSPR